MNRKKIMGGYLLSFLIPIAIMLLISIKMGFYPFGEKSIFIMDMKNQYLGFYASLRYLWQGDDSLFFSWSRSWGGNRAGLFAYYLASPASFLTVLFPLRQMSIAIGLMTILKVGLCGLTFFWMGRQEVGNRRNGAVLLLAVGYALCSYNLVYSMCPMWLDGVIFLPLIIGTLQHILDGKTRGVGYILALAATMYCSYYIGYMTCLFIGLFSLYYLIRNGQKVGMKYICKKFVQLLVESLLAIGLTAPLLIPNVMCLLQRSHDLQTDWSGYANFAFFHFFGKFVSGTYDTINYYGLPSVYCGLVGMGLMFVFFLEDHIQLREKIGAILVLLILTFSFYWNPLNLIWHGFQAPSGFPYRYAFVFSFFMLFLGCRAVDEYQGKLTGIAVNKKFQRGLLLAFLLFETFDMAFNGYVMIRGLDLEFKYIKNEDYLYYLEHTGSLVEKLKQTDKDFYRINQQYEFSKNDALLLGYNGLTHYSSTYNDKINKLSKKMGMAQTWMWNSGYGATPVMNSLLSVKYVLDTQDVTGCYELMDSNEMAGLYRNNNCVPIAYATEIALQESDDSSGSPFEKQSKLLNSITGGNQEYFQKMDYQVRQNGIVDNLHETEYTFRALNNDPVYMYINFEQSTQGAIYVNNQWITAYFNPDILRCVYVGTFAEGEEVTIRCTIDGDYDLTHPDIVVLNSKALQNTTDALKKSGMDVEYHKGAVIKGNIEVKANQKIMTSIPYDEGWNVYIDGQRTKTECFANAFLMVEAEPGVHQVEFRYVAPGFRIGVMIALVSAILLVSGIVFSSSRKDMERK